MIGKLSPRQMIGTYSILSDAVTVGECALYDAVSAESGQRCSIAVLPHVNPNEPQIVANFVTAAKLAGRIPKEFSVEVIDAGRLPSKCCYVVMKYVIGRYQIIGKIAEGGMAIIYEALLTGPNRKYAIKILRPEYARNPDIMARLRLEAQAANLVNNPGVVQIADIGHCEDNTVYLVMEFLQGETLADRLKRVEGVPPYRLGLVGWPLLQQIASVLQDFHLNQVVHRDVKPGNVMVVPDSAVIGGERAKLLDLGLAKRMGPPGARLVAGAPQTQVGMLCGTPIYMAPEQWEAGGSVDGKIDVYAFGVLIFRVLAGSPPFPKDDPWVLRHCHLHVPPPSLKQFDPELPDEVVRLVGRMLAKAPADRPSMLEVIDALKTQPSRNSDLPAQGNAHQLPRQADPADLRVGGEADRHLAAHQINSRESLTVQVGEKVPPGTTAPGSGVHKWVAMGRTPLKLGTALCLGSLLLLAPASQLDGGGSSDRNSAEDAGQKVVAVAESLHRPVDLGAPPPTVPVSLAGRPGVAPRRPQVQKPTVFRCLVTHGLQRTQLDLLAQWLKQTPVRLRHRERVRLGHKPDGQLGFLNKPSHMEAQDIEDSELALRSWFHDVPFPKSVEFRCP